NQVVAPLELHLDLGERVLAFGPDLDEPVVDSGDRRYERNKCDGHKQHGKQSAGEDGVHSDPAFGSEKATASNTANLACQNVAARNATFTIQYPTQVIYAYDDRANRQ